MVRVRTASRLHFGLLAFPGEEPSRMEKARQFGGTGLMVQEPVVQVMIQPSPSWSAEGPLADRALQFAGTFADSVGQDFEDPVKPCRIVVEQSSPEHCGLGAGTQLALAVTQALARLHGLDMPAVELARRVGRGKRSALGIHGFAQGGFLVEGGKGPKTAIAPLLGRVDFPETWGILLVIPRGLPGLHGTLENQAFAQAFARIRETGPPGAVDALCRLVLLGMWPALIEKDLASFGEALFEFNRRAGEVFHPWQGGTYAHPRTSSLVEYFRSQGVAGVGQSSWGPTVFAVTEKDHQANLKAAIQKKFSLDADEVLLTHASNRGALVE